MDWLASKGLEKKVNKGVRKQRTSTVWKAGMESSVWIIYHKTISRPVDVLNTRMDKRSRARVKSKAGRVRAHLIIGSI